MDVKIGQVWRDKDKRRNTTIEIINIGFSGTTKLEEGEVVGLAVGTEQERIYKVERLTSRWTLVATKDEVQELVEEKLVEAGVPVPEDKPEPKFKTREQWLVAAVAALTKAVFKPAKFEVPEVRVSVGWPGGRGKKSGVIGQCFATTTNDDKIAQIFVSPVMSDPVRVLATLTHEIVHAIDDCKSGHKGGFIKIAREIGFESEWTSSDNRGEALSEKLVTVAEKLGTYPHSAINLEERPTVQKTYMLKVMCQHDDEFFVRMTQTKLDDFGAPICPCHRLEMVVEEK